MDMLLSEAVQKATSNEFAKSVLESEKFGPMTDSQKETIIQLIEIPANKINKLFLEGNEMDLKDLELKDSKSDYDDKNY